MSKIVKTWLLETEEGRSVLVDEFGNYTLSDSSGYPAAEFREGEHPGNDKDKWAASVSKVVGVPVRLIRGPDWSEEDVYG